MRWVMASGVKRYIMKNIAVSSCFQRRIRFFPALLNTLKAAPFFVLTRAAMIKDTCFTVVLIG